MGIFDVLIRNSAGGNARPELRGGKWADRQFESKHIDELIGVCRGVLMDGSVSEKEARMLAEWLEQNRFLLDKWPANAIYHRLNDALADGKLTADEEKSLLDVLAKAIGNDQSKDLFAHAPSSLPWDDPAPQVTHAGNRFCLTGDFVRGSRDVIKRMIQSRDGIYRDGMSGKINYLIVGLHGSAEWKHAGFGTKIIKAVELRSAGTPIAIVSEKHWLQGIGDV